MRCVVLDDYQDVALTCADWSVLDGVEVETVTRRLPTEDAVVETLAGAEVVVLMRERTPLPRRVLDRLPDLRLVVTTGRKNAVLDMAALAERGIPVCGTGSLSSGTAELTWALVLAVVRHVPHEAAAVRDGGWQSTLGTDLAGRTLGVIGLGRIGSRVAAVARAFEMDVLAWSPHLTPERAREGAATYADKRELLERSDVVSLHLQLSDATRGILGADDLAAMRPTSYLVNTARSGLVDSAALEQALRTGAIAGAGLDVFDTEPLPADDPLRSLPTVVATPHLGYVTEDTYRTFYADAVDDVRAWLAGEPVRLVT